MPYTVDNVAKIMAAIREVSEMQVLIGIPEENDPRPGEAIGNAAIGYIQENGSPARNIPARPHLAPGVESAMNDIQDGMKAAAAAAGEGDIKRAEQSLNAVGIAGRNGVVRLIRSNIPPPLSARTIAARRRRTPGSTYRRQATGASDVTALIDTTEYLRSITYVVRKRKI